MTSFWIILCQAGHADIISGTNILLV